MQNLIETIPQPAVRITRKPKRGGLNIIGISAGYHDSACCLLDDGTLVAAVQEERFSRIKNDKTFPRNAFRYCLDYAGLSVADIDCIAYYEDPLLKLGRQIWMSLPPETSARRREATLSRVLAPQPAEVIARLFGYEGRIEFVGHHLSHAASSYYFSGFEEAAIMTVDGVGEWATTTYGYGAGTSIQCFEVVDFPDSLGLFYSAMTSYLGFEVNEGEYKVMGLAPYGTPIYADRLRQILHVTPQGQFHLNMKYFGFLSEDLMYTEELISLLGNPPRKPEAEILKFHQDVAKSAQVVLEEVMLEKIRYLHSKCPSDNLCMAGGVALNVVANSRCLKDGPFKHLFVQPAAGDAGASVGAAAIAHVRITGGAPTTEPLRHVYLGPCTDSAEIYRDLVASSAKFWDFRDSEQDLIRWTVDALTEGKIVGWFHGRMEFGPRALGSRSILADPRRPEMRDRINALVKMRESFRPFAPSVLASKVRDHFDLDRPSRFMLETCHVRSAISLPAITHIDGSARVQTVDQETNPRFWALLEAFDRRTGCPILLNTSFNLRGEPIVCSATDAIVCFIRSRIDVLVLEDFVVERSGIPALWKVQAEQAVRSRRNRSGTIGHMVYTLL